MKSALRIFLFLSVLLTQNNALFCGPKPSIFMPCGHWEDQDINDRLKNAREWTAADQERPKTITITNTGIIPFNVRTNAWSRSVCPKKSISESYPSESFLEIFVNDKKTRCQLENTLKQTTYTYKKTLSIAVLPIQGNNEILATIDNTYTLLLETTQANLTETESDISEASSILSLESAFSAAKAQEELQNVSLTNQ